MFVHMHMHVCMQTHNHTNHLTYRCSFQRTEKPRDYKGHLSIGLGGHHNKGIKLGGRVKGGWGSWRTNGMYVVRM